MIEHRTSSRTPRARRLSIAACAAMALGSIALGVFGSACDGILGNVDLDYVAASDGSASTVDATAVQAIDATAVQRVDGSTDANQDDARSDDASNDASVDGASMDAGSVIDAAPVCPFDAGCPCMGAACGATDRATLPDGFNYFVTDSENIFFSTDTALLSISFATGQSVTLYTPGTDFSVGPVALRSDQVVFGVLGSTTSIEQIPKDGGTPTPIVADTEQPGGNTAGLAANDERVYWSDDNGNLRSALLDGGGPLGFPGESPGEIQLDTANVYFGGGGAIFRMPLDISRVEATIGPWNSAGAFLIDPSFVYWFNSSANLYQAPLAFTTDAGNTVLDMDTLDSSALGDDGYIYFTTNGSRTVFRCLRPSCRGGPEAIVTDDVDIVVAELNGTLFYKRTDPNTSAQTLRALSLR